MTKNCIICQIDNKLYNIIDNYHVCLNCFHIVKEKISNDKIKELRNRLNDNFEKKENENCIQKYLYNIFNYKTRASSVNYIDNNSIYTEYLFSEIESLVKSRPQGSPKLKIASVYANNTFILDEIRKRFNVDTISISEHFNPSYFSPHKCYKLSLEIYANNCNLHECNYDSFDLIILNDMLDYVDEPIYILNKCKMICNTNAQIYSVNLHTSILLSLNYININKNTNHIFNTNSIKTLCKYSNFVLDDSFSINNDQNLNLQIYKITNGKYENENEKIPNPKIIDCLYNEICLGLYNISSVPYLKDYWDTYFKIWNITFDKYRNKNFTIIGISDSNIKVNTGNYLKIDEYINEIDINQNLKQDNRKILFVILNYEKYQIIYDKLNNYLTSRNHFIFDIDNLIVE